MKLDPKAIRYLTADDWRTLTAVEIGSRNHEVVPTPLIVQISGLRGGNSAHRSISNLAKVDLIARLKNAKYDGYRLTYGGLDYLALHAHLKSSVIFSLGPQIGVGKESDIFTAASPSGEQLVLKLHRLGRISFRTVKTNRDYLRGRNARSWMYMARLAAVKEFAVMRALHDHGFPVPKPVAQNRHTLLMELVEGWPLVRVKEVPDPAGLYAELISLVVRLARHGLIHGDFNEFNILIEERPSSSGSDADAPTIRPVMIDFPQIISVSHPNAEFYFNRDVNCIKRFFQRRFHFESTEPGPFLKDALLRSAGDEAKEWTRLDVEVEAAGFSRKMARELEVYMREVGAEGASDDPVEAASQDEGSSEDGEEDRTDEKDTDDVHGFDPADEVSEDLINRRDSADLALYNGSSVFQDADTLDREVQDDSQLHSSNSTPSLVSIGSTGKQAKRRVKAAGWSI